MKSAIEQLIHDLTRSRDEIEEARLRYWSGCAMRSLESITGVSATDLEWRRRLWQLKTDKSNVDVDFLESDLRDIELLIRMTTRTETQMGKVLNRMKVHFDRINPSEIKLLITIGYQILLAIVVDKQPSSVTGRASVGDFSDLSKMHALHLGIDERDNFFSRSDEGVLVGLDDSSEYCALIFEQDL